MSEIDDLRAQVERLQRQCDLGRDQYVGAIEAMAEEMTRANTAEAEVAHWKGEHAMQRETYRELFDGMSVAEWHAKHCGAMEGVEALQAEVVRLKRGGKTLGKALDDSLRDVLAASGRSDLIGEDGDGDWALIWESLAELRPRAEAAEARVARVEAAIRLLGNEDITPQGARVLRAALDVDA